jgi:ABC-type nickel/cobalt efflux system permease component RcnA
MVFISSLALGDGMSYVYVSRHQSSVWRTMLFCLLVVYAFGYSGVVVTTVLFYVREDWLSSFLSDTRRTWLNNALVGFLILDLVFYLYSSFRFLRHRNRVAPSPSTEQHANTEQQSAQGRSQPAQGSAQAILASETSLGGSIRVVGFANAEHAALDMRHVYKKNK